MNFPEVTTSKLGKQIVTARAWYKWLGLSNSHFSTWAKTNIINSKFAKESTDWSPFAPNATGQNEGSSQILFGKNLNTIYDYYLTIEFAERLAMMASTSKGDEARRYFQKARDERDQLKLMLTQPVTRETQRRYLDNYHGNKDALSRHGINKIDQPEKHGSMIGAVANHNNYLSDIKKGERPSATNQQKILLGVLEGAEMLSLDTTDKKGWNAVNYVKDIGTSVKNTISGNKLNK